MHMPSQGYLENSVQEVHPFLSIMVISGTGTCEGNVLKEQYASILMTLYSKSSPAKAVSC